MHLNNDLLARRKRKYKKIYRRREIERQKELPRRSLFAAAVLGPKRKINSDVWILPMCAGANLFVLHSSPAALSQPNENI